MRTSREAAKKRERKPNFYIAFCLVLIGVVVAASCGANEGVLHSGRESPSPVLAEPGPDSFEKEVAAMNEAGFTWIYVFRRKDGGELDAEDKGFIRTNTSDTNRRVLSDGGNAVIIGSNYFIGDANLKSLKDRFDVRDLSLPEQTGPEPTTEKKK